MARYLRRTGSGLALLSPGVVVLSAHSLTVGLIRRLLDRRLVSHTCFMNRSQFCLDRMNISITNLTPIPVSVLFSSLF